MELFKNVNKEAFEVSNYDSFLNCHVRITVKEENGSFHKKCSLCKINNMLKGYEKCLFRFENNSELESMETENLVNVSYVLIDLYTE